MAPSSTREVSLRAPPESVMGVRAPPTIKTSGLFMLGVGELGIRGSGFGSRELGSGELGVWDSGFGNRALGSGELGIRGSGFGSRELGIRALGSREFGFAVHELGTGESRIPIPESRVRALAPDVCGDVVAGLARAERAADLLRAVAADDRVLYGAVD